MNSPLIYTLSIQSDLRVTARVNTLKAVMPAQIDRQLVDELVEATDTALGQIFDPLGRQEMLRALGIRLYELLFAGDIRGQFRHIVQQTLNLRSPYAQIHLRLLFQDDVPASILRLPWELLYLPDEVGGIRLGTDPHFCLSYGFVNQSTYSLDGQCTPDELKVLFVHMHPQGYGAIADSPIRTHIEQLSSISPFELNSYSDLQPVVFQEKLEEIQPNIVHFLCHGELDNERGFYLLCEEDGSRHEYTDDSFASLFTKYRPQLVILHACQSGQVAMENCHTGGAMRMVHRSIPTVIAMRYPLQQVDGWNFFKTFYHVLAETKRFDIAVQAGRNRLAVQDHQFQSTGSSISPLLWMNQNIGWLFPPDVNDWLEPQLKELIALIQPGDPSDIISCYKASLPKLKKPLDEPLTLIDMLNDLWEREHVPEYICQFIERYARMVSGELATSLRQLSTQIANGYPGIVNLDQIRAELEPPVPTSPEDLPFLLARIMHVERKSPTPRIFSVG